MKKSFLYYFFAVVCTVCLFTACSDDDDDDNNKVLTTADVAGTYAGKMDITTADGTSLGEPAQSITLTKISDTKVKLELKNFAFGTFKLGDIEAECTAIFDAKDNDFDLAGTTTLTLPGLGELPIAIDGDADGKEADIDITVTNVPVLQIVKVDFKGKK